MRHRGALSILTCALGAVALALSAGSARAQVVYDDQDWTLDRGVVDIGGAFDPQSVLRQGFNNFIGTAAGYAINPNHLSNDPDHARKRWVFPDSIDIAPNGAASALYVENPFPASALPPPPPVLPVINGVLNKAALSNGQQANDALSYWSPNGFNTWTIPIPSLRVFEGGFSYSFDPTLIYDFDYGYTAPTAASFTYVDASKTIQTATTDLLEQLPYVPASLYQSVQNTLVYVNTGAKPLPTAVWSIGTNVTVPTNTGILPAPVPAGNYGVDIYSPGDGTETVDKAGNVTIHPNLYHVFVRVSWGVAATTTTSGAEPESITVNYNNANPTASPLNFGTGAAGGGGINDPYYSRIYMVDMSGSPGWRHIAANGSSSSITPLQPAAFPFDGVATHQIVVTLYAITPDNLNDTNLYGTPPLVTADAVRFVPLTTAQVPVTNPPTNPTTYFQQSPLAYISPSGTILGPTAGSNKIATGIGPDAGDPAAAVGANKAGQAVFYVARNELVPNPAYYPLPVVTPLPTPPGPVDPTQITLTPTNDISEVLSVPVFYCLENMDEGIANASDVLSPTFNLPIPSKARVRWRFMATPDQQLTPFDITFGEMGDLGNGASIASPLLANVRCRDGKTRNMVFFVTTNNDGTLGHIYALDPLGNNPFDGFNKQKADPGDLTSRTTNAFWVYPSVRPLLSTTAKQLAQEPPNPPLEWNDPNFTLPTSTGAYAREVGLGTATSFPATTTWAPDQLENGKELNDGDIISGNGGTAYVTRSDTRLTMPGMAWAPTLIDDPDNPAGAQILVVSGQSYDAISGVFGGRLYSFDAGGRGDFGTVQNADGVTLPASGTTQRLWTWPHFGADAFHRTEANTANGYTENFQILDEAAKGFFSGSPVFDDHYPTAGGNNAYKPVIVGSADGHMYAVLPFHDRFQGLSTAGTAAFYNDSFRSEWVYPDPNVNGGIGLGAGLSTPTFLQTGSGRYLYFTCDGTNSLNARVYAIPEAPVPGQPSTSGPFVNTLYWVYPYTTPQSLPLPDPNNTAATQPLFPGFTGSAPVAINATSVDFTGQPAGLQLPQDTVYVVQNDGTVTGLAADPGAAGKGTTLVYSQGPPVTGLTNVTPMVSLVEPLSQDGLFNYTFSGSSFGNGGVYADNYPSLLFGDQYGGIYGFGLISVFDGTGTATGNSNVGGVGTVLPLDWGYPGGSDPTYARYAPVTLTSGYDPTIDVNGIHHLGTAVDPNTQPVKDGVLTQGDNNGQLYAYSIGSGPGGVGETVGTTEPGQNGNDLVDIDVRVVNYYEDFDTKDKSDWEDMMLGRFDPVFQNEAPETPAKFIDANGAQEGPNGNGFPAPSTLGQALDPTNSVAVDWGGWVYISAWGVYHAQPLQQNAPGAKAYGLATPVINVTFNIQQPGGSTSRQVTVPAVIDQGNGNFYPGDRGYINRFGGDYTKLSIWGSYYDSKGNLQDLLLTGNNTAGQSPIVYPWVAKTKFQIIPDQRHPYTPGISGDRVWVQASISQQVVAPNGNGNGQQRIVYNTPRLFAGQNDQNGKQTGSGFQTSPNDVGALGKPRPLVVTNPLGLTTRAYTSVQDQTAANQMNIIGWGGAIDTPGGLQDPREVLGNGTSIGLPDNALQKSLFAPVVMSAPGSSATYMGYDSTSGQLAQSLYVMDRSNIFQATGHPLRFSIEVPSFNWHGGATSVMNPLPWETIPDDQHNTLDYPAIPSNNISVTTRDGTDVTHTPDSLTPPDYPAGATEPYQRVPVPTPLNLTVKIPQFQPANVNRGMVQIPGAFTPDGNTHTYGSSFIDDAGNTLGQIGQPILGPMNNGSGTTPTTVTNGEFPAAGYIARGIRVTITLPGQALLPTRPPNGFAGASNLTYRQFISGTSVSPQFSMGVQENLLDFGKVPAGAGYSDPVANSLVPFASSGAGYRVPFAPTGVGPYQSASNTPPLSPWDDPNQMGQYFLPFTLTYTGNVNLVDLRINKLYGVLGATISADSLVTNPDPGTAVALRLLSNEVSDTLTPQLLAVPFGFPNSNASGKGVGNIGFVSSFDHYSTYASKNISDFTLYPIANPTLDANAISQAQNLYNLGLLLDPGSAWGSGASGLQPRPTLHKPRVGDGAGTTATTPDTPHDYNTATLASTAFQPRKPEIGIAVPVGTPAGTYNGTVIPYEDHLPTQWAEWLSSSRASNAGNIVGNPAGNEDGILNLNTSLQPIEPYANPGIGVKLLVHEGRLTGGTYASDLSQIDPLDPLSAANLGKDLRNTPTAAGGVNMQPAPIQLVTSGSTPPQQLFSNLFVYWTTNRQPQGSNFAQGGVPEANSPYSIAFSELQLPYNYFQDQTNGAQFYRPDAQFGATNNAGVFTPGQPATALLAQWWTPAALLDASPFPNVSLFPNTGSENPGASAVSNTVKFANPATAQANSISGNGLSYTFSPYDNEAYLTWMGQVDKQEPLSTASTGSGAFSESRLFWAPLDNVNNPTQPPSTTNSLLNDPQQPKYGPHPLLVKMAGDSNRNVPAEKMLYFFWAGGPQARTSLYYGVNAYHANGSSSALNGPTDPITPYGFGTEQNPVLASNPGEPRLGDQKLPTPNALVWQSDPYPVFRRVVARNPFVSDPKDKAYGNQVFDAIDLYYTGVMKNRQTVEVLMTRYGIYRGEAYGPGFTLPQGVKIGQLFPLELTPVIDESAARVGSSHVYKTHDIAWYTGSTAEPGQIVIQLQRSNGARLNTYNLNYDPARPGLLQKGRFDPASGLIYFDAVTTDLKTGDIVTGRNGRPLMGGGKMVVDARSGTISFPDVAPLDGDNVLVTYIPQVMRLNTSRADSNLIVADGYGSFNQNQLPAIFTPQPVSNSPGSNSGPIALIDRATNPRQNLKAPQVVFGNAMPTDRLWVLYRKSDLSGGQKSTIFLKAMRLMARLPYPAALTPANSQNQQQIASLTVTIDGSDPYPALPLGPYEVDWVRGRVYFTEADEGRIVDINYTYATGQGQTGNSGNLVYRVAWGDEISLVGKTPDETAPEVTVPMDAAVNEGQVAAFKDLALDKLWIFWSSNRAGTTDLYYETIAPQFYPSATTQQ